MKKLEMLFAAGWGVAGLLALHMVLSAQPVEQARIAAAAPRPLVDAIRASCELPAGTVVFVVRDAAAEAP